MSTILIGRSAGGAFFQLTANGGIMRSFNNQKDDMRKKCECVVYVNVSEVILKQL